MPRDRGDVSTGEQNGFEQNGFVTPIKFFRPGCLNHGDSTLVDSMLTIFPTELDDIPQCERNRIIDQAYKTVVTDERRRNRIIDHACKSVAMAVASRNNRNLSSVIQWEFRTKSYNDSVFGNSEAGTTAASLDHDDKDQDVDSGATYCFYLYGHFDLAKEWESKLQGYDEVVKGWESKLQGYNEVVKEWESKLQGYNGVSYRLYRPWKRPRFG